MNGVTQDARQACALRLDARQARRARKRWWVACAAIGAIACAPLVACTDGITPDCSSAEAGCGPDLTGIGEGGNDVEAASIQDSQIVDSFVADAGPGDASSDADARD